MESNDRDGGIVVDLEKLQEQAETLFLHRFVEAVKKARGEHGRYLVLRAGDQLAIHSAGDGSLDELRRVVVLDPPEEPGERRRS